MMPVCARCDIARRLDQAEQDVLDILADVAGLGQRGGVGDREGHIEQLGQRLGQQRLAAAGRADQQDVALLELDVVVAVEPGVDPLVVVVDGDREDLLGAVLADDVLVELLVEHLRGVEIRAVPACDARGLRLFLFDDLAAELHALVADVDLVRAGDQPATSSWPLLQNEHR